MDAKQENQLKIAVIQEDTGIAITDPNLVEWILDQAGLEIVDTRERERDLCTVQ